MHLKSNNCYETAFPFYVSRDIIKEYLELHRHDFVEIEYTISGHGYESINGVAHELKPGNLSVLFPWNCHDLIPDEDDPLCFIKVCFDIELFLESTSPFYQLRSIGMGSYKCKPYVCFTDDFAERVKGAFLQLENEYANSNPHKEMLFCSKIIEILINFDRARHTDVDDTAFKPDDIWDAVEYVHQSYNKDITASSVAEKFKITEAVLNANLEKNTGLRFSDLLNDTRIRNACAMLIYHKTPVSRISKDAGFNSEETFFRVFKSIKGISPSNYRKKHTGINTNLVFPYYIDAKILYYIHCHYHENLTLADLAKEFHYNEKYLCDILKSQTGQSFTDLLQEIRIFHATTLLLTTDNSVTDICFDTGFSSSETFLRVFKKYHGISPSEYRKQNK